MKRLLLKIKLVWLVFTTDHCALIHISSKELENVFQDKDADVGVYFMGLREYPFYKLIRLINDTKNDTDMIVSEVSFKAEAEGMKEKTKI